LTLIRTVKFTLLLIVELFEETLVADDRALGTESDWEQMVVSQAVFSSRLMSRKVETVLN
jgi:hypothetical protein